MKFVIVVFVALFACAAAEPQINLGAVGGLLEVVGNPSGFLHDAVDLITGPDGLLGTIVKSGLGKLIGKFVNDVGNVIGLKGLGCVLKSTLNNVSGLVRHVDSLLAGLVCTGGVVVKALKPILVSLGQREFLH